MIARLVALDLTREYADMGRCGIAPDGLVWISDFGAAGPQVLAALAGTGTGLVPLLSTTSPAAAAELAGQVSTIVAHRLADRHLAARIAGLAGTRLVPAPGGPAASSVPGASSVTGGPSGCAAADAPAMAATTGGLSASPAVSGLPMSSGGGGALMSPAGGGAPAGSLAVPGTGAAGAGVPVPVGGPGILGEPPAPFGMMRTSAVPATSLCEQADGEFVLITGGRARRGRAVAARVGPPLAQAPSPPAPSPPAPARHGTSSAWPR
jgi:hypothetical protein